MRFSQCCHEAHESTGRFSQTHHRPERNAATLVRQRSCAASSSGRSFDKTQRSDAVVCQVGYMDAVSFGHDRFVCVAGRASGANGKVANELQRSRSSLPCALATERALPPAPVLSGRDFARAFGCTAVVQSFHLIPGAVQWRQCNNFATVARLAVFC